MLISLFFPPPPPQKKKSLLLVSQLIIQYIYSSGPPWRGQDQCGEEHRQRAQPEVFQVLRRRTLRCDGAQR